MHFLHTYRIIEALEDLMDAVQSGYLSPLAGLREVMFLVQGLWVHLSGWLF